MVDSKKLKARIVLAGYTQGKLAKAAGMSVNSLNAKINGRAPMNCDEADTLSEILNINTPAEKCEIFLA